MNKEEMISEIERYLSHVIAKDFPLPKAIRLMYEEYKNSNKAWEKIYDEDQDYIGELNDKILDLEFKIEKQQKEIEDLKFKYQIRKDRTKAIIEGLQEELEEKENKYDDFTTAYLQGVYDGKKNLKYKIKEFIEEKAMTDTYNFKTIAVKDIEEFLGE